MKNFCKNTINVLVVSAVLSVLGMIGPMAANAATSPGLGAAATYSILAGQQVTNTGATTIGGDVGISPGASFPNTTGWGTVTLGGTLHDSDTAAASAQADENAVFTTAINQGCDTTYVGAFKELSGLNLTPGVYCADSFHLTGGTLTLTGTASDVWIFKSAADVVVSGGVAAKVVFVGGGSPCNLWWRAVSSASLDANSTFAGNILADTGITFAAGSSLTGRAFARTASVTLSSNSIAGGCAVGATKTYGSVGTIDVVKTVINDNGGTKKISDFPLFVNGTPVVSGYANQFASGASYKITETSDSNYAPTFSGDCNASGMLNLNHAGDNMVCLISNNDIGAPAVPPVPPLIDVVKVPSPLALPAGPGTVTYAYTLKNIGTISVTDVTMVDDSCSAMTFVSGDTNGDKKLDVSETWTYRCSTTLSATHTNTVVATGWANGISATDIANATVVVGLPVVPPLIHVTKVPSPLTLLAKGGMVTYTEKITNPGTVALSNVTLTDDKCSPMKFISGDTNGDGKLDSTETWTYTCRTNLTKTTTNTALATGEANGLTVRDFAVATVVVAAAVPALPNTGYAPESAGTLLNIVVAVGVLSLISTLVVLVIKKRSI